MQDGQIGGRLPGVASSHEDDELVQRKRFSYAFFIVKLIYTTIVLLVSVRTYLVTPVEGRALIVMLAAVGLAAAVFCLALLRYNFITLANALIFALDIIIALSWAHLSGGTAGGVPIFLFSVFAAQAFLLPRRLYLTIGIGGVLAYSVLTILELSGKLVVNSSSDTSTYLFNYFLSFLSLLAIATYFSSSLQSVVIQLRQQKQVLDLANSNLVEQQRTRELVSDEVIAAASSLASRANEGVARAGRAASAVNHSKSVVEELSEVAGQIAGSAQQVSSAADHTLSEVANVRHSAEIGVAGITRVLEQVSTIAGVALQLEESSHSLDIIVVSIESIAAETRLLALNATIEAVSAGEYGTRFAVIAAEVQALASSSNQATEQVRKILGKLEEGINSVVYATRQGVEVAERGAKEITTIGEAMKRIEELSRDTAGLAGLITLTTTQQRGDAQQAATQMQSVLDLAAEEAEGSRFGADAAVKLREMAGRLNIMVATDNGVAEMLIS